MKNNQANILLEAHMRELGLQYVQSSSSIPRGDGDSTTRSNFATRKLRSKYRERLG